MSLIIMVSGIDSALLGFLVSLFIGIPIIEGLQNAPTWFVISFLMQILKGFYATLFILIIQTPNRPKVNEFALVC